MRYNLFIRLDWGASLLYKFAQASAQLYKPLQERPTQNPCYRFQRYALDHNLVVYLK